MVIVVVDEVAQDGLVEEIDLPGGVQGAAEIDQFTNDDEIPKSTGTTSWRVYLGALCDAFMQIAPVEQGT